MLRKLLAFSVLSFGIIVGWSSAPQLVEAQNKAKGNNEGRTLFTQYCVSCHGTDAKGTGPVAKLLKKQPANLTKIEKENGKFPFARIERTISGEQEMESHGTREMPVWGSVLRRKHGAGFAKLEIYNLTRYVESIQE